MLLEAPKVGFRDARLERTHGELAMALQQRYTAKINRLSKNRAQQRRFSYFLSHPRVHLDQLISQIVRTGREKVQHAGLEHLLVPGDTTQANLKAAQGYRNGENIGVIGNNADPGFFLHPGLALCPTTGQPLGCVSLQVWTRNGDADMELCESQKWFKTARDVKNLAPRVTVVNDREGDVYDLWVHLQQQKMFMVTRARHDRRLVEVAGRSRKLWARLAETSVSGYFRLQLEKDEKEGRSARKTEFSLRFTSVSLPTPGYVRKFETSGQVDLVAIEVHECLENVPEGETPVAWRLLTNHQVTTFEEALQIVQWYVFRWRIEETFSAFKTRGLDLESTQLADNNAVLKLGVMVYDSATKATELVKAREDRITPATAFFSEAELECMEAVLPELEGKTEKQKNPYPSRCAAWAVWILARLGSWHGSGKPGLIIIKRGIERFEGIYLGYTIKKRL